jgi:hypothetical protein
MSFNPAPSGYFPNINMGQVVSGTTGVFIPWSNLENINSSTSGDVRQLAYAFNEAMNNTYSTLPASGQSLEMSLTRAQSFNSDTVLRRRFISTFNVAFSGLEFIMVFESGV